MSNMFENVEEKLKKWAVAFIIIASVLVALSFLAALIILGINARYLWWISLIVLGGGFLLTIPLVFSAHVTWGFAEIVENTKKSAKGAFFKSSIADDDLPDL